ncbi:murein biosynthesis integral membrane protein MurJ [Methylovirgula sp. 4M-Z18]|uniref:murein biosynthesis integral membrane protein MurJ n=1 Tax=Methylovirgula sp. 4M-Z18 TaxID=2293567 RepID=UPI000E2E98F2|nr:murein biosynthesis integral membrane protein MurJ [Methylovirgula sp. 4M-Z18]RFB78068.1 murein biosynthesis integral membrane protein MurJ [Methylovirgula sp. 4M-Z18]
MSLARSFLTVGSGTALSRLLGFARDMLIASSLGSGPLADAFVVAFRLPNLFRRLLSEGAFNSAFVPAYIDKAEANGAAAARAFAANVFAHLCLLLLALTVLAEIFMPLVVYALAPGFAAQADKFALTVFLARLTFPFLSFAILAALFAGLLNAAHRFTVASFAPVALNIVLLGSILLCFIAGISGTRQAAIWLSVGVSLAGLAQLLLCGLGVRAAHVGFVPRWPKPSRDVGRLLAMSVPGILAGGITHVNAFVGTIIGSAAAGAVSYLYYADRVYQLPLGIVGVALGLVLLPELSRHLARGDESSAQRAQSRALEFSLFLTLPASVALCVAAEPIVTVLFQHGVFSPLASGATAATLRAYALGLAGYIIAKALQPAFFARHDMRRPMLIACFGAALDIVLSLLLFRTYGSAGIAFAASLAGWFNALGLGFLLWRRGQLRITRAMASRCARLLSASLAMGLILAIAMWFLQGWLDVAEPFAVKVIALAALCGSGLLAYLVLCRLLGAMNWSELRQMIKR